MKKTNLFSFDRRFYTRETNLVASIDEVGRASLAGPVVATVVILPKDLLILDLNDSKQISRYRVGKEKNFLG
jgi:ribonuclease HII